jgi:hypothetical protein
VTTNLTRGLVLTPKGILELSMGKLTIIYEIFIGMLKDIYGLLLHLKIRR